MEQVFSAGADGAVAGGKVAPRISTTYRLSSDEPHAAARDLILALHADGAQLVELGCPRQGVVSGSFLYEQGGHVVMGGLRVDVGSASVFASVEEGGVASSQPVAPTVTGDCPSTVRSLLDD